MRTMAAAVALACLLVHAPLEAQAPATPPAHAGPSLLSPGNLIPVVHTVQFGSGQCAALGPKMVFMMDGRGFVREFGIRTSDGRATLLRRDGAVVTIDVDADRPILVQEAGKKGFKMEYLCMLADAKVVRDAGPE